MTDKTSFYASFIMRWPWYDNLATDYDGEIVGYRNDINIEEQPCNQASHYAFGESYLSPMKVINGKISLDVQYSQSFVLQSSDLMGAGRTYYIYGSELMLEVDFVGGLFRVGIIDSDKRPVFNYTNDIYMNIKPVNGNTALEKKFTGKIDIPQRENFFCFLIPGDISQGPYTITIASGTLPTKTVQFGTQSTPTPTSTETPTNTPTPSPSETPTATPTPSPTDTPNPTDTPSPTETPTATPTPTQDPAAPTVGTAPANK